MKIKKIKVPYYKWKIVSIIIENYKDREEVLKKMKAYKMYKEHIDNVLDLIDKEAVGGAMCHYNDNKLICVIITFPHRTSKLLTSTLIHECRHAADRIIETTGIEGSEAVAYLNEYITMEIIKDYIKDETYKF